MRKDYAAGKYTTKNVKEKVQTIRKEDFEKCHDMQAQYDLETRHSEIVEEQKKWEKKVDDLLKATEEYAPTSITVTLK